MVVIGFLIFNSNIYVQEANINTTFSSSYQHFNEYFPEEAPEIGILIKGDEDSKYKKMMAEKIKSTFESYNYEKVTLLQYEKNKKPIDIIINVRFETELSRLSFYRKGKIKYDFYNESLSYYPEILSQSVVDFNCYGDSSSNFKGIISTEKAKEVMIKNSAREFVKNINNHSYLNTYITTNKVNNNEEINRDFSFALNLSWFNFNEEKSVIAGPNEYQSWILENATNIEVFTQQRAGNQILINYKTESEIDEIINYYNNLLAEKNIDYNKNGNQDWMDNYSNKKVLGFKGLKTEDFILDIVIDYLPLKESSNHFAKNRTDIKTLENKNVQIIYWDYNNKAKALERIRRGNYQLDEINKLLTEEKIEKDPFYYQAKLKLLLKEIEKEYWEEKNYPESMEKEYLTILNKLETVGYKNMDIFYEGLYYQNKANMLHSPELNQKAQTIYKKLTHNDGYSKGAEKRIKQLEVMPYLETVNYQKAISELKNKELRGEFLEEYELLMKAGEFEKALDKIENPTFSEKPLKVILYALLDREETSFELLKERDNILSWELSKAISYQLRGEGLKSSQKLDEIIDDYPEWQIRSEINKLYLRTGLNEQYTSP